MMKTLFNKIITFVTLFSFLASPANALNFSFDYSDFGTSGNYKKSIVYTLLAALNASNTAPLTALTGSNLTQTATSPVTIANSAGTLFTLPAGYPAAPGATYSWDTADGATLGAELVTNGGFDTDTSWTKATGWTISGGVGVANTPGTAGIAQSGIAVSGKLYTVTYSVISYTSGGFRPRIGTTIGTTRTAPGVYTETLNATGGTAFDIVTAGATVGTIDNVSLKEITPAVLAPGLSETATVLASGLTRYTGGPAYNPGLAVLAEQSYTAHGLHSRDLSNAAWVKTNCTGVKNATGTGGVANTASTLTATANDATALQTVTLASGARGFYPYIKRKTGTGGVFVTIDNGGTWAEVTSSLATDAWYRASSTKTAADPIFGFKLAVSGDAIEVDYANQFSVAVAQSPIETTTATVTAGPRYNPLAGSELGSKITLDATPYELGREQYLLGGTTGKIYQGADNKIYATDGTTTLVSTSLMVANTTAIIGVDFAGGKLYFNGTEEDSDVALSPTWGAAPNLGATSAGGSVFNGTISVLQSSSDANFLLTSQIINLPNYEKIIYLADRKKKIKTTEEWREAA